MIEEKLLLQLIQERFAENGQELPVFHNVAVRLQQLLASRTFEIDDVIELISEDQSLSGRVLKVANASYYAGLTKIATIKDAIVRLGAQEIANMAMLASQYEFYNSSDAMLNRLMQELWGHALSCAVGAKWLIRMGGYPGMAAEAFMGGLMHDIGKLALLKVLDDLQRDKGTDIQLTEKLVGRIMTCLHEEVGYALMKGWNFPDFYCDIAVKHHGQELDGGNILLAAVRLANLACRKLGRSLHPADPSIVLTETPETQFLGLTEVAMAELEIIIEDADSICMA